MTAFSTLILVNGRLLIRAGKHDRVSSAFVGDFGDG